tara:strand:- start:11710 stop:12552 length:843 start_codon:yes stop_codon:yes gene_type:complete
MWEVNKKDLEILKELRLDENPFRAVDEYSPLMSEIRWELPEQQELYKSYTKKREVIENKDVDNYYKEKVMPIDKKKWKYLMARKAWYVMPLGWDNIALNGGKVIDIGTGDGDVVQRLIDFVNIFWQKNNILNKSLHIIGLDLNSLRIKNANRLVSSPNKNITFEFEEADLNKKQKYDNYYFDFALSTSVIEIISPKYYKDFIKEIARLVSKGIYIADIFEKFPGGYPRDKLSKDFLDLGFKTLKREVVLSEPFDKNGFKNKIKIWPSILIQNLWLEKNKK